MKTAQKVAFTTCAATLVLIAIGVWVRASGSGLGCPDWPLCHGQAIPPGDIGHEPIIEFIHRVAAAIVGLLVVATAILAWVYYRHSEIILWSATATVPLVGLQGFLGALTVWRELPPELVATHLLLAMIILSLMAIAAVGMYRADPDRAESNRQRPGVERIIGRLSLASLLFFMVLLWIGGYMTESGAATACGGWPLCDGHILPANDPQEITHMLHRYLAAGFIFLLAPLAWVGWKARHTLDWAGPVALAVAGLYLVQVFVGALNVWFTFPQPLTISHTVIAALLWFTLSVAAVLGFYAPVPSTEEAYSGTTSRVPA
jgi:heme A synthase